MNTYSRTFAFAFAVGAAMSAQAALTFPLGAPKEASLASPFAAGPARPASPKALLKDPAVRERYARHFGMSDAALTAYLGGLHAGSLAEAGDYTVYSTDADGAETPTVERLPEGEPVLMDAANRPVILEATGDPLVAVVAPLLTAAPQDPDPTTIPPTSTNAGWAAGLPALLFGGGVYFSQQSGGSQGSSQAVPEPASLVALGVGAASLLRRRGLRPR